MCYLYNPKITVWSDQRNYEGFIVDKCNELSFLYFALGSFTILNFHVWFVIDPFKRKSTTI
jgi:hypothetical protein